MEAKGEVTINAAEATVTMSSSPLSELAPVSLLLRVTKLVCISSKLTLLGTRLSLSELTLWLRLATKPMPRLTTKPMSEAVGGSALATTAEGIVETKAVEVNSVAVQSTY